jgi:hypothetical protein
MSDTHLKRAMADLLADEPTGGLDVRRALADARTAQRSRRIRVGAALTVAVVVVGVALPLAQSARQRKAVPPIAPLPITGTLTRVEPLCESPESAASTRAGVNMDPLNVPAGRVPSCAAAAPTGRLASAFGYIHGGVVSLSPFDVTLPSGWAVVPGPDEGQSNGWLSGFRGNGSHVLRLRSADGSSGVDFVTEPSPLQPDYRDPVTPQHAYGATALPSREAKGLADWTQNQPWMRPGPLVSSSVGGRPAWTVDTGPRTGADTEAERGTCDWVKGVGCDLFMKYSVPASGDPSNAMAAYLRPGTTRLIFFDAPGSADGQATMSVAAVLWDQHPTPDGLVNIRTTIQPIIDSIRFPGARPTS